MSCCPWNRHVFKRPTEFGLDHLEVDPFIGSELIIGLEPEAYERYLRTKHTTLVMFYNQYSRDSFDASKEFEKAARKTKRKGHSYAALDCIQYHEFCYRNLIHILPSFKLYNWDKHVKDFTDYEQYKYKDMKSWVESIPPGSFRIEEEWPKPEDCKEVESKQPVCPADVGTLQPLHKEEAESVEKTEATYYGSPSVHSSSSPSTSSQGSSLIHSQGSLSTHSASSSVHSHVLPSLDSRCSPSVHSHCSPSVHANVNESPGECCVDPSQNDTSCA